jgi:hypothetical protein
VATWADVQARAMALPEVVETGPDKPTAQWRVGGKLFAWERPLRRTDLEALGLAEQDGPVLAARVADEGVKHALVADDPAVYFTTPHFEGYPAILVRLDAVAVDELGELLTEAWLLRAPKRLAQRWRGENG